MKKFVPPKSEKIVENMDWKKKIVDRIYEKYVEQNAYTE